MNFNPEIQFITISPDNRIVRLVLGLIMISVLILVGVLNPESFHFTDCAFKNLTGLDCPGCGITRSFHETARLHLSEAFYLNLMGPLFYLVGFVVAGYLILTATYGLSIMFKNDRRIFGYGFVFLMILWLLTWLFRLAAGM